MKNDPKKPFKLLPFQEQFLKLMNEKKKVYVMGGKQSGKTAAAKAMAHFKQLVEEKIIKFPDAKESLDTLLQFGSDNPVSLTMAQHPALAIAQFDTMTRLGFKLNLITQRYE